MASASGRKTTKGRTNTKAKKRKDVDIAVKNEVMLIAIFAAAIFLFLCVIHVIKGSAAEWIRSAMFGVFGLLAYVRYLEQG